MAKADVLTALTCAGVEAEVEAIRFEKKQAEIDKSRREAEQAKRRARQLGHVPT